MENLLRLLSRKIDFLVILTAGYGVESPGAHAIQTLHRFTSANKAFPMLITRALHAQSIILGCSVKVVRNFNDPNNRSDKPYSYYYESFLVMIPIRNGIFQLDPDLVVICLELMIFTYPHPDEAVLWKITTSYLTIITNYPSAKISCVSTTEKLETGQEVVEKENNSLNHPQVFEASSHTSRTPVATGILQWQTM